MDEPALDLRGIVSVLLRQSRLILATIAVVVGLTAVITLALTPTYTSSTLILVDPSSKNLLDPSQSSSSSTDSARVDSEVELARSDSVLLRVIESEGLASDTEFVTSLDAVTRLLVFLHLREPVVPQGQAAIDTALTNLRNAITVQRRSLTYLISVQVRSEDPAKAARIANATADAYIDQQIAAKVGSVETARSALDARTAEARQAVATTQAALGTIIGGDFHTAATAPPELFELQQSAELARAQYRTLLARSRDLAAQAELQIADSRIVSSALAPQHPSFPNKALILTIAALFATGIGVALAFLYENLIGGFTSQEQLEAVLATPVAAVVPRARPKSAKDSLSDLMVRSPLSSFAESIRRARASIEQSLRSKRHGSIEADAAVIMVTSTTPNEGKTTFALSLARSYALSGQRVLLVDCDLRNPGIHRQLGWEPEQGLLELLTSAPDGDEVGAIANRDGLANVTVITGAHRSDIPTDQLLAGPTFGRLIQAARQSFDTIILDTPPLQPVVDGLYIAPSADVICLLTRWSHTSQQSARKSVAGLVAAKRGDAVVLAVLNQQDEPGLSYAHRHYYSHST